MTSGSSTPHVDEWLADYRARMQAAVHKRAKPECIDELDDKIVILHIPNT
jgi:hypothetical protein